MTDWRNVSADIFPHSAFSDTEPHHCSSTTNFCTHPRPTCHHHHSLSQPQPAPPSTPLSTNIQLRIGRDTNPHFDWKSLSRQTWFRNSSFFHDSILQSLQNKILISALWLCLSLTRARWLSLSLWSQEARSSAKGRMRVKTLVSVHSSRISRTLSPKTERSADPRLSSLLSTSS